jgi:hypothetical protein
MMAGMSFGAAIFCMVGGLVIACATLGTRPAVIDLVAGPAKASDMRPIWMVAAIGFGLVVVFGLVGLVAGKAGRR